MSWTIVIRTRLPALCFVFGVLAGSSAAQASISDFRLPPDPSTQQPSPTRQGPVAPDVPESRGTPAPAESAPMADPTPPPVVVPVLPSSSPAPQSTQASPPPASRHSPTAPPAASAPPPLAAPSPSPPLGSQTPPAAVPVGPPNEASAPIPAATSATAADRAGGAWWIWVGLGIIALGLLAVVGWRRRPANGRRYGPPQVERPRVPSTRAMPEPEPEQEPQAEPRAVPQPVPVSGRTPTAAAPRAGTAGAIPGAAISAAGGSLALDLEPMRLSLTLLNATLAYRLTVTNRTGAPIQDLLIVADMISAHASMSREEQLSGPISAAVTKQRIDRLDPGESRVVQGEFRLPFPQIVPIRQGNAALLMPLARFRLEPPGATPVVRTFVVGQPGSGAGLQPFRLDLGPRIYPTLVQRAFA